MDEGANVLDDDGKLVPGVLEGSGTTPSTGTVYLDGTGKQTDKNGAFDLVFQKRIPMNYTALNLPDIGELACPKLDGQCPQHHTESKGRHCHAGKFQIKKSTIRLSFVKEPSS